MSTNFGEKLLDLANLFIIGSIIGPIWFEEFRWLIALVMFVNGVAIWLLVYWRSRRRK